MTWITVWKQDFLSCEQIPADAAQVLYEQGIIRTALKPMRGGKKLKPVFVSLDAFSKIRDLSCQMGPRVIEGNAMGFWRCVSATAAWAR